ncbi:MAG: hypothetical protein Q4G61_07915 [Tissierellia bacterium]|nr:hypothetical protein [Tissierellia bacterium]
MDIPLIEFRKTLKRNDAILLICLALWPALVSLLARVNSGFFVFGGVDLGALEFTSLLMMFQDMIFLPVLLGVYIASMTFFQEIHGRQIYMYKDIPRTKILNAKYFAVYGIYLIFLVLYLVISFLSYYTLFSGVDIATGTLLVHPEDLVPLVFECFQVIIGILFYIHIGLSLALRYHTGVAIFGTTLIYMFVKTTPHVEWAKYLTPVGFREILNLGPNSVVLTLLISLAVWCIYNIPMYLLNRRYFKNADFN